jgi:hypothetical protein
MQAGRDLLFEVWMLQPVELKQAEALRAASSQHPINSVNRETSILPLNHEQSHSAIGAQFSIKHVDKNSRYR